MQATLPEFRRHLLQTSGAAPAAAAAAPATAPSSSGPPALLLSNLDLPRLSMSLSKYDER